MLFSYVAEVCTIRLVCMIRAVQRRHDQHPWSYRQTDKTQVANTAAVQVVADCHCSGGSRPSHMLQHCGGWRASIGWGGEGPQPH